LYFSSATGFIKYRLRQLVIASQSTLEEWASNQGIPYSGFPELCSKEESI